MQINPIATIKNDFDDKFAVPRQSGIADRMLSVIELNKEFSDEACVKGLDGFSHLWLIWEFDRNTHKSQSLTVRPPRLGGNERVGVFASRSPFRPNPLGLSSVKLEAIEKRDGRICLIVSGADLVSGTPIYDIKPYIRFSDSHEDAISGYVDEREFHTLTVKIPENELAKVDGDTAKVLYDILANDPRPAYKNDEKEYGFKFAGAEIKFVVNGDELTVKEIIK